MALNQHHCIANQHYRFDEDQQYAVVTCTINVTDYR